MDINVVFKALSPETLEDIKDELEDIVGAQSEGGGSPDLQEALAAVTTVLGEKDKAETADDE